MPSRSDRRARAIGRGLALASIPIFAMAACAATTAAVTLPGGPLSVSVATLGQCQSSYPGVGGNFYPGSASAGDCGFFMGFPEAGNPAFLQRKVFGFQGVRGPGLAWQYTAVHQGAVSGSGTPSDPYQLLTIFKVSDPTQATKNDYALIEDTTRYVDGEAQFSSTFDVENVTGESVPALSTAPPTPLRFHAIYAGDLLIGGGEFASGVLSPGPPRVIGGADEATGTFGGFVEAPPPAPQWSSYQSGCWDVVPEVEGSCPARSPADGGIWAAVRAGGGEAPVFDDDVDPNPLDDGAGVSWDDHLGKALKPGEHARYTILNRAEIPSALAVAPATQAHAVEQNATVRLTATGNAGTPYGNRRVVYSIGPANPKSGSVLTDPAGVAKIEYVGTAAGSDTVQMYLDLGGSGSQTHGDPTATARVTWMDAPPTPSGRYRLLGVHASAAGAVRIVLVPLQDGTARAEVAEPTAALSRGPQPRARRGRCKRGQILIGHRCRPLMTVSGRATANAHAGRTLRLTVRPSRRLTEALAKGRSIRLMTRLTYTSALGGKATARTLQLTVKGATKR